MTDEKQDKRPWDVDEANMPLTPMEAASEAISTGHTLVRLDSREMLAIAQQHPRDPEKILGDILALIKRHPEPAKSFRYTKPVGKDERGMQQYASGLSIRAAECIISYWGNIGVRADKLDEDDLSVHWMWTVIDYERHIVAQRPVTISKFYKPQRGGTERHKPDRFADVVTPAKLSIGLREAVLRIIPPHIKYMIEDAVVAVEKGDQAATDAALQQRRANMVKMFARLKVPSTWIMEVAAKPIDQFDEDDLVQWHGIYQGLKTGETTIEEVFGPQAGQPPKTTNLRPPKGGNKLDEMAGETKPPPPENLFEGKGPESEAREPGE